MNVSKAEMPHMPGEDVEETAVIANEFGEALEVVPFVRGQQPDGLLKLSLIRKVSPDGIFLAKRGWIPTVPNSFGLPPGETCPGQTEFCEACYAFNATNNKGVQEMLDSNYELLQSLESEQEMTEYLAEMVQRYSGAADHFDVAPEDRVFRIHWSGDFYSKEYARAWAAVTQCFPDITYWAFTRSFREPVDVVPELDGIANLQLWLSTDTGNIDDIPPDYDHLPRANSARDVRHAKQLERQDRRTITCPENLGRLELMQDAAGACIKCRVCFRDSERPVDVNFVTSGKHDARRLSRHATDVEEQPVAVPTRVLPGVRRQRYVLRAEEDLEEDLPS